MELDELKNTWNNANTQVQNQNLTTEMLEKMNEKQYRSKMKKITLPEMIGSLVCLAAAVFIGFRFYKLDTIILQVAGVLGMLLLLLVPVLSLLSTYKLSLPGNVAQPYAATLKAFATQKIRFIKLQKINVFLSYLLLVTILVLLPKLFNGQDLSGNKYFWLFSFTLGYIFLMLYSKWVMKYYKTTLKQAEELLHELAAQ